jgi:hypothetical protein
LPPRTQRIAAGAGAGGLVIVILAALVLGPLSAHGASDSSNHSGGAPGIAAASPSSSASASASASGLTFGTASPTPRTPDDGVSPRVPDVLAKINCTPDPTAPVSSGGRFYVSCDDGARVIAIDLATDTIAQAYTLDNQNGFYSPATMVVDRGLWMSFSNGDTNLVQRLDLTTGNQSAEFRDSSLIADVGGVLWITDGAGNLFKVNPMTATKSAWHSTNAATMINSAQFDTVACGMIWGQDKQQNIIRVNPATDVLTNMGNPQERGTLEDIIEAGSDCWAVVPSSDGNGMVLARQGKSCTDMVTSDIDGDPYVFGDTYWLLSADQTYIYQVEPFGGRTGRHWLVATTDDGWIASANGQIWVDNAAGLTRVDIPLDRMRPGATPATLTCHAPAASPTPAASATPPVTPSPTDTTTPTPSASDSTTP